MCKQRVSLSRHHPNIPLAYIDDYPVGEEGRDRDWSSKKSFSLMVTETDFRPCDVEGSLYHLPLSCFSLPSRRVLVKKSSQEAWRCASWAQGKDFAESKSLYRQETGVRALHGG